MLRNVLVDYLDTLQERAFDFPFLALLPALGFHDVHYTHGQVEFGKDFIAKKTEDEIITQYSFQLKAGDIGQSEWRNDVMGQMLESVINGLSHPAFDRTLPHQPLLVTTGRLKGNVALSLQDLNTRIQHDFNLGLRSVLLWDRETLATYLEEHALGAVYHATAVGFSGLGSFYMLYGRTLRGDIAPREIELHSRHLIMNEDDENKRILAAVIESEIIAAQCVQHGLLYEAFYAYLTAVRVILCELHRANNHLERSHLLALYERALEKLRSVCWIFYTEAECLWEQAEGDLVRAIDGPALIFTYPVYCARILEVTAYLYYLAEDDKLRQELSSFIEDFVTNEPGCAHTPSDRYAVSLVLPLITLCRTSRYDTARALLKRSVVWLCDRYEEGWGLAPLEADPYEEIATLFGYPFECIEDRHRNGSFLASVLADLTAFLGDRQLYSDVVNDIKACQIHPQYWQVPDTSSLFRIDGPEVITYPYVNYADDLSDFECYDFAEHIEHEPGTFDIANFAGPSALIPIMLLLRDRYFPTLWSALGALSSN